QRTYFCSSRQTGHIRTLTGDPDRDTRCRHRLLRLGDRVLSVVEDRGAENRIGSSFGDALDQVIEGPDPAGGDYRDLDRGADRTGELEVVALVGPVAVHAGEQDLPRAALGGLDRPLDGVAALRPLAAAG